MMDDVIVAFTALRLPVGHAPHFTFTNTLSSVLLFVAPRARFLRVRSVFDERMCCGVMVD